MFIRMTKYCDKVSILKSVSVAVEAFDADGKPLKGIRKSTTVQVAVFEHNEQISHPEITDDEALFFEGWRATQLVRMEKAFIENAAAGKLGGYPLMKAKNDFGNPAYKVGEFSGVISTMIEVQPGMIKNIMNGKKTVADLPQEPVSESGAPTLAERVTPEAICSRIKDISEDILRYISLTNRKGTEIYTLQETLDMRVALTVLGCATDSRGIGYPKVTGPIEGRNAAEEGFRNFNEIKKRVYG